MKIFSAKDGKIALECECCHKIYNFPRGLFSDVSEKGCTNNVPIQCPNCMTSIPAGTYIKGNALPYEEEIKKARETKQNEPKQKANLKVIIFLLSLVVIVVVLLRACKMISDDYDREYLDNLSGKSWVEMNDGERDTVLDLYESVLSQDN